MHKCCTNHDIRVFRDPYVSSTGQIPDCCNSKKIIKKKYKIKTLDILRQLQTNKIKHISLSFKTCKGLIWADGFTIAVIVWAHFHSTSNICLTFTISTIFSKRSFSITSKSIFWSLAAYSPHPPSNDSEMYISLRTVFALQKSHPNQFWWYSFVLCLGKFWVKHQVVIVYQTVPPRWKKNQCTLSHKIFRNIVTQEKYIYT